MIRYIEKVLVRYIAEKRDELDLPLKQPALAIFDVFSTHRHTSVLDALQRANIKVVYVPAGCTVELQPLDLKVNKAIKDILKKQFHVWYADQVTKFLKKNKKLDKFEIDLRLSVIKPINARWLCKNTHTAGIVVNQ